MLDFGLKNMPTTAGPAGTHAFAGFRARSFDFPAAGSGGGSNGGVLRDTFFSEMVWNSTVRSGHWEELNFSTRVAGWGWHRSRA